MWYNGYKIGNHVVYNPYSLICCLNDGIGYPDEALKSYWVESGNAKMIEDSFTSYNLEALNELFQTGLCEFTSDSFLNLQDISKKDTNAFLSLMFHSGYLTRDNKYLPIERE